MKRTRRLCSAALGLAVLAALVLVGPSAMAQPQLTEVLFGNLAPSASEWPIYLAEAGGFLKQEGIELTIVAGGGPTPVIQALASGGTNIADDGTDSYIAAVAHDLPIKMIAPQFQTMPYQLMVQPSITSWQQLKGKSVTLGTKKDVTAIAFYRMADVAAHFKDTDFSLVVGGTSNARYAALVSGNVQGAMLSQPFDLLAVSKGMRVLASGSDYFKNDWMFTAIAVNTAWANSHRDLVVRVLRAFRKAIAWGYTHREQAVTALVDANHVERSIAEQAYDLDFVKWKAFDRQQRVNVPAVQNIANIMVQQGDITSAPSIQSMFDLSYAIEAAR
jgi:ABC-type nitrate/sulfonate/bicarbonate transport system substrate-binding protein